MNLIELKIGTKILLDGIFSKVIEGNKCKYCYMEKNTKYHEWRNLKGRKIICGSSEDGNICGLACRAEDRSDGKDIVFSELAIKEASNE